MDTFTPGCDKGLYKYAKYIWKHVLSVVAVSLLSYCVCLSLLLLVLLCFQFPFLLLFSLSFIQSLAESAWFLSFFHSSIVCFNKPFPSTSLFVICLNQTTCIHLLQFQAFEWLIFPKINCRSQAKIYSESSPSLSTTAHINKRAHI